MKFSSFKLLILTLLSLCYCSCEQPEQTPSWKSATSAHSETQPDLKAVSPEKVNETNKPQKPVSKSTAEKNSVFVYYNLRNYLTMRRGNSELPKPEHEISALITNILAANPDILAVCEIGSEEDLQDLSTRLTAVGIHLPHSYLTTGSDPTRKQAILSKFPITSHKVPHYSYTLSGAKLRVKRGILDASIQTPQGNFRFLGVHLKSKRPSKHYDESLVRWNEARILRQHVSSILNTSSSSSKILVYGDMNDTKNSAPLRTIKGPASGPLALRTIDLEAEDGTRWTQYWNFQDIYSRFDFALSSQHMSPHIDRRSSSVLSVPKNDPASDHRALIISLQ